MTVVVGAHLIDHGPWCDPRGPDESAGQNGFLIFRKCYGFLLLYIRNISQIIFLKFESSMSFGQHFNGK